MRILLGLASAAGLFLQTAGEPARLAEGGPPGLPPPQTLGGGQVFVELHVDDGGAVTEAVVLRTTPPYTDLVLAAVRAWRFEPAQGEEGPRDARVLVAAVYRPPTLYAGEMPGEPPRDVATASAEVVYPTAIATPPYPPDALVDGVVVVEVLVDEGGAVAEARVVRSAPGLDEAALQAARQWRFRPARIDGVRRPQRAYLVFGFRQPVVPPSSPR